MTKLFTCRLEFESSEAREKFICVEQDKLVRVKWGEKLDHFTVLSKGRFVRECALTGAKSNGWDLTFRYKAHKNIVEGAITLLAEEFQRQEFSTKEDRTKWLEKQSPLKCLELYDRYFQGSGRHVWSVIYVA